MTSLMTSIGSVVGHLDSAGLTAEYRSGRVEVQYDAELADAVREAWGKRVEVSGLLYRDDDDRVVRVEARHIDILAEEHPPLTDLVGLDPNFTGGMDVDDYLALIRGEDVDQAEGAA